MSSSSDETSFNDDEESYANPSQSDEEGHEDKDEHEEDDSDDDEESEVKKTRIRINLSGKRQAVTFSIVLHVKQADRMKGSTPKLSSRLTTSISNYSQFLIIMKIFLH